MLRNKKESGFRELKKSKSFFTITSLLLLLTAGFVSSLLPAKALPITTVLSEDDLNDPQPGYLHAAMGIEKGSFVFGKRGDQARKIKSIQLDRFLFSGSTSREVIKGFTPKHGYCRYISNQWSCLVFSSYDDVISYQRSTPLLRSKTHITDVLICNNCKPIATPGWMRTCPGYYQDIFTGKEQKDKLMPSYPELFTDEGDCIYKKPWFKTLSDKQVESHLRKVLQP